MPAAPDLSVTGPMGGQNIADATDITFDPPIRGFQVGFTGDVKVDIAQADVGWTTFVYPACIAGVQYSGHIKKIYGEETTASNIAVFR